MKDMSNNTDAPTADQQLIEKAREFVRSCYGKPQTGADAAGQDALVNALLVPFTAAISARLSLAVEALEFYADKRKWVVAGDPFTTHRQVFRPTVQAHGFDIAAQALANIKGEGGEDEPKLQ